MGIDRRYSEVHSIPDKTSTGPRRIRRKSIGGRGTIGGEQPPEAGKGYQLKRKKKMPASPLPPRVKVEKTNKGKRWLSPGEVELSGDVLEIRDRDGKIVDAVLIPSPEEKKA